MSMEDGLCVSKEDGTGRGVVAHLQDEDSMAVLELGYRESWH